MITITLTDEEQELVLAEARLKGIFGTDAAGWYSIASKIRFARLENPEEVLRRIRENRQNQE